MKSIDWHRFLQEQREKYGKVVFTRTELANVSSLKPRSLHVALQRLVASGVMQHYTRGRYGPANVVAPEDLVASLDSGAYITGMYALYRHQIVTQMPTEIICFTNRRHNRSRVRRTTLGRIVFVCVTSSVYSYPKTGVIASPEQAFCDFVYLCQKRGVDPSDVVTFRNLERLDADSIQQYLQKYLSTTKRETERLLLV